MNKKRELRNNKNVYNYECLLKRMLYCAGNGQELLSALGVTLVCHASNVFLVLKVPLSIIRIKDCSFFSHRHSYSVAQENHLVLELRHHKKACRALSFSSDGLCKWSP